MKSSSQLVEISTERKKWYKNPNIWTIITITLAVLVIIILTATLLIKNKSEKSRILSDDQ